MSHFAYIVQHLFFIKCEILNYMQLIYQQSLLKKKNHSRTFEPLLLALNETCHLYTMIKKTFGRSSSLLNHPHYGIIVGLLSI